MRRLVLAVALSLGAAGAGTAVRWTPPELSSDQDESSPTFSPDGREVVFMRAHVFQVGPLLPPRADRLLFAQAGERDSGELFVADLVPGADRSWPPTCGGASIGR